MIEMEFTICGELIRDGDGDKKAVYIDSPKEGEIRIAVNDGNEIAKATVSVKELQYVINIINTYAKDANNVRS